MRVAAVQLTAGPDPRENLARAVAGVREAASRGAELVVLPEKWRMIGDGAALAAVAEPLSGSAITAMAAVAAELEVDLVAGSVPERPDPTPGPPDSTPELPHSMQELPGSRPTGLESQVEADPRPFNTAAHLRPDGTLAAAYRKVHRFDADVDGRRYRESDGERAGDIAVVSRLTAPAPSGDAAELWTRGSGMTLGLAICFDLRFPELFAALGEAGADVIALPSAFTARTTEDHWAVLVRARAIELGAYVVAATSAARTATGLVPAAAR